MYANGTISLINHWNLWRSNLIAAKKKKPSIASVVHIFWSCFFLFFTVQEEADGSNEYNNFQFAALNTTKQLIKDLKNIDIVFHIGDLSYANGYISQWDQFTAQIEPIASTVPYMVARSECFSPFSAYLVIYLILYAKWWFILSVVIMSATGLTQVPSMGTQILEENVECCLRQCSISLLKIGLNSGMESYWP